MTKNPMLSTLNEINSNLNNLETVADLAKDEKLSSQITRLQKGVSQMTQAAMLTKEVINRTVQVGQTLLPNSQPFLPSAQTAAFSSPFDFLTTLFKRPPTGLQFTLTVPELPPLTFSVIEFDYRAHYHDLFRLEVLLSSSDAAISSRAILDKPATLSIWQNGELQQTLTGMVAEMLQSEVGFHQRHYRLVIYPDLWRLTLRHNSRIFQKKSIDTILSTLLNEHQITDYAFVLRYPHPEREYCVQYRESDFDFFQRLSAEEGIFYYFEQENGQHRLILTDDIATLSTGVSLPYQVNRQAQLQERCITRFRRTAQLSPTDVVLKDYTFKKPHWHAQFQAQAKEAPPRYRYEHYDYPGRFKDGRGKAYSQYRLDSLRAEANSGKGESNSPHLHPGKLFQLTAHPNANLNTLWQPIQVHYTGKQPQAAEGEAGEKGTTLTCQFQFIPSDQTWRPSQRTKPRIPGPQMALVVGPKAEEIYTDNYGRVRLHFFWDRESQQDDHSSCWVRVTQPWAGKGWGMMAIPRVGHEVLVNFLDGDPDQPIVMGRAYHANNLSPAALPANKTQMHLMSQTYKGKGYNGLLMEDATTGQRLDFQAQKDMTTAVLNNKTTVVNNNHSETVGKAQHIKVEGNRQKTVLENELVSIRANSINEVGLSYRLTAEKHLTVSSEQGDISLVVGGSSIQLTHDGKILINGTGTIKFNGEGVFFNAKSVSDAEGNAVPDPTADLPQGSEGEAAAVSEEDDAVLGAYLSNEVYTDRGQPLSDEFKAKFPGVEEVSDEELKKMGIDPKLLVHEQSDFQANIYKKGDKYFLAFRGTESLKDVKADVNGAVGKMNPQFERAKELSEVLKRNLPDDAQMRIAGHSLGGELASIAGLATGVPTYSYNSAGLHPKIINELQLDRANEKNITAFYTDKDELSLFQDNRKKMAGAVLATGAKFPVAYAGLEAASNVVFDQSLTGIAAGTLFGDDVPQAIGNRVKLKTGTGHTISATKEFEREIRGHYAK